MKEYAIKEHHLYNKTFAKGRRFVGRLCAVYVLRDYAAERIRRADPLHRRRNRVGLSVGKKIGGAVARNRAKRLLREGYRAAAATGRLEAGYLVVLTAREEIRGKKSGEVVREVLTGLRRLGLLPDART